MFYVSKITPFFFFVAFFNLFVSLIYKSLRGIDITFLVSLVFGFIVTVIVGAMYQIFPNSQNRKLSYPFISYIVFFEMVAGLILNYFALNKLSALIILLSLLTFTSHIFVNVKNWYPPTVRFLGMSLIYLFLSGFLLFLNSFNLVNLQVVIHTVTVGVMLNAVYGVELAWIPMLTMTTLNVKDAFRLFYLKQIFTPLLLLSFYILDYKYILIFSLLEIGTAFYFLYIIYKVLRSKITRGYVPPVIKLFLLGMVALIPGMIMGYVMALLPSYIEHVINIHINLLIYGFTAFTVFGGIMHLLPRVIFGWVHYNKKASLTMNELVDEKNIPKFIKFSFILYILYLLTDVPFLITKHFSFIFYLLILLLFSKVTFVTMFIKLWRRKHVSNKAS